MTVENPNPNDPETKPDEGQQGAAPEPNAQAKPWWEARGFKSEEEALSSWDESQRALTEANTARAASERALQALSLGAGGGGDRGGEGAGTRANQPGYRRYFEGENLSEAYADPDKYAHVIMSAVDKLTRDRHRELYVEQENARKLREAFFDSYKDLKPYTELVALHTQQVVAENPGLTFAEGGKEVARRVRAQVAKIKSDGGNPEHKPSGGEPNKPKEPLPHSGAGGAGTPSPSPKAGDPKAPPVDDVASEIDRRVAQRQQRTVLR